MGRLYHSEYAPMSFQTHSLSFRARTHVIPSAARNLPLR